MTKHLKSSKERESRQGSTREKGTERERGEEAAAADKAQTRRTLCQTKGDRDREQREREGSRRGSKADVDVI